MLQTTRNQVPICSKRVQISGKEVLVPAHLIAMNDDPRAPRPDTNAIMSDDHQQTARPTTRPLRAKRALPFSPSEETETLGVVETTMHPLVPELKVMQCTH